MGEIFRMHNPIQHYDWGSHSALAAMQGRPVPTERPEAELWMGAHASAPSAVEVQGQLQGLDRLTPDLPFLLKVLAIAAPLSIQVHPSPTQARQGFERENREGIPLDASRRSYRDDQAKPETVVALTSLWLLVGEQPRAELTRTARALGLEWLTRACEEPSAVRAALTLPDREAAGAVEACLRAAQRLRATRLAELPAARDEYVTLSPAATALEKAVYLIELLDHHYPGDRGMLVALCMNFLHLEPGQALHTPAGQIHAYVSGTAVEVMGCSDNVLRAGLTRKHMDVPELLSVMPDQRADVTVLDPDFSPDGAVDYPLWDSRLSMAAFMVHRHHPYEREITGTSVLLVTEGSVTMGTVGSSARPQHVDAGHSVLYTGGPAPIRFTGEGLVFCVTGVSHP